MTKSSVVRSVSVRRRSAATRKALAAGLSNGNYKFEFIPSADALWNLHCRKTGLDPALGSSLT